MKEEGKNPQQKRKRTRHRKKGPKVENLVSKTFNEAKLLNKSLKIQSGDQNSQIHQNPSTDQVIEEVKIGKLNNDPKFNNLTTPSSPKLFVPPEVNSISPVKNTDIQENKIPADQTSMVQTQITIEKTSKQVPEKTREEIKAEREAKKIAKQQAKKKGKDSQVPADEDPLKKIPKQENVEGKNAQTVATPKNIEKLENQMTSITISEDDNKQAQFPKGPKPTLTKAERRAIQEAQRAAKAASTAKSAPKSVCTVNTTNNKKPTITQSKGNTSPRVEKLQKTSKDCKVKLFNHLDNCRKDSNLFVNNLNFHPIIVRLGEQYAKRTIVGSNARCISFLSALKKVIQDYETPAKKEFARSLESSIKDCVDHLHKCRPLAVSVWNAYKHIKHVITQLSVDQPESELKEHLCHFIDTYIENQIGKAAEAISSSIQDKISNGDVILTFGCSSLINFIFEEAHRRKVDFRVIVVDSRPFLEGQELLRRLTASGIPCTYVLINAVGFVMPEVTKILLGTHALLSNGYVMARTGTAQVALVARSFNVPVLVCCETHKFSERFQTDAIVYNELGNPDDLIMSNKCRLMNWESQNKLCPLNLNYDITPPELVTAVVTEVAILPCTSVPVILRIKPTEIGY